MNNYELYHHGVKGMKWGIRRYQNKDGSLTPAGKKRQKILDDAVNLASSGKKYAYSEYERFTKLAEKSEAGRGKTVSRKEIDKWLKDEFGDKADDLAYVMDQLETDDIDEYVTYELRGGNAAHYRKQARIAKAESEIYSRLEKKYSSMYVSELDKRAIKQAKDFAKGYLNTNIYHLQHLRGYELESSKWTKDAWLKLDPGV